MNNSESHTTTDPKGYLSGRYMFFSIALSVLSMAIVIFLTWTPDGFQHIRLKRLPGLTIALVIALLRIWFSAWKLRFLSDNDLTRMGAVRVVLTWDFA